MKKSYFFVILILCSFLFSCTKKSEDILVLDDSHPLALAPDISWAVVTDPYVAYKTDKSWDSEVIGHCRRGDILQVIGKSEDTEGNSWYYFREGWVSGNCLSVYNNRYRAQKVSETLIQEKR